MEGKIIAILRFANLSFVQSMTGEWSPTEENSENKPPLNNNILGHVLRRLMEMFYPPKPKSSREFPSFPVKGCVLGKMFSGKTTCAKFVEKGRGCLFVRLKFFKMFVLKSHS